MKLRYLFVALSVLGMSIIVIKMERNGYVDLDPPLGSIVLAALALNALYIVRAPRAATRLPHRR
jgi:threonine/homoserine efflux transporter RhtA